MAIKAKIAVAKIIARLESRLEQNVKDEATKESLEAEYQQANKKWQEDFFMNYGKSLEVEHISTSRWNNSVEVRYKVPAGTELKEPERKHQSTLSSYEIDEITNAISILKMTEDEYVSASTFRNISKYL